MKTNSCSQTAVENDTEHKCCRGSAAGGAGYNERRRLVNAAGHKEKPNVEFWAASLLYDNMSPEVCCRCIVGNILMKREDEWNKHQLLQIRLTGHQLTSIR